MSDQSDRSDRSEATAIRSAEVELPAPDLDATLAFFVERLGFRIELISPADDPAVAVVCGHGLRLRLDRASAAAPGVLRVACDDPLALAGDPGHSVLRAPNGTMIHVTAATTGAPLAIPPLEPSFVLTRLRHGAAWGTGRAGMTYRDLVPGRQGGRFIASHIRIPDGGPVPDYVHFHDIRFQMIYCYRGWVRVVYEDQGPPFVLRAGDCVLQPPRIRHRVLEASAGLEVIEVGCPAHHDTFADHDMELPTATVASDRDFGGQRFVHHVAEQTLWQPAEDLSGYVQRDTGIGAATGGLAGVRVLRPSREPGAPSPTSRTPNGELAFSFVLDGSASLRCAGRDPASVESGDAFVIPAGVPYELTGCTSDLELLDVTVPAASKR